MRARIGHLGHLVNLTYLVSPCAPRGRRPGTAPRRHRPPGREGGGRREQCEGVSVAAAVARVAEGEGGGGGGGGSGGAAPVASAIGSCTSHLRRAHASNAPPPAAPPSNAHLRSPTLSRAQPLVTRPPAAHPPTGTGAGGVGRRRTRSSVYWWQGEGRAMGGSAVCGGARRRAASARASALSSARPERPAGCAPRHRPRYAGWGTRAGADGGRGSDALHGLGQEQI